MMASEVKGYSCNDGGAYDNEVVCAGWDIGYFEFMGCYFASFEDFTGIRNRCILYQCNISFTLGNLPVVLFI